MCDYSLEHLASRPAKVGDQLVTTKFGRMYTTGLCAVGRVWLYASNLEQNSRSSERLNLIRYGSSDG
jgi:hypothetical protein